MSASKPPSRFPKSGAGWSNARRTGVGAFRWFKRALLGADMALAALLHATTASGRDRDEFTNLVRPGSPGDDGSPNRRSDEFWELYYQAYSPRLWRMRRLLTLSAGEDLRKTGAGAEE